VGVELFWKISASLFTNDSQGLKKASYASDIFSLTESRSTAK